MSDSDISTAPDTPERIIESSTNIVAFAVLRPINSAAQFAFDTVVTATIKHLSYKRNRRFLSIEKRRSLPTSVFTENEEDPSERTEILWQGFFKFSLDTLPEDGKRWRAGTGDGADLLFASPTAKRKGKLGIAKHHVNFSLHPDSCRVVLEARHSVTISRGGARTITQSQTQVLEHNDLLSIGDGVYTFEYTDHFRTVLFEESLKRHMREFYAKNWVLNPLLSPASITDPVHIGNYLCSPSAFMQGTFGKVAAGWTREGVGIAIKHLKYPARSELHEHQRIMRHIGRHDCVLQLLDCIEHFNTPVLEAFCVYQPLGVTNLAVLIKSHILNPAAKLTIFDNCVSGLKHIHSKGIMHRDIKPDNLGIISLNPPRAFLLDFDTAIIATTSVDHDKGTLQYLAPEMVALKQHRSPAPIPPPYGHGVDVWALGLSLLALHLNTHPNFERLAKLKNTDNSVMTLPVYEHLCGIIEQRFQGLEDATESFLLGTVPRMIEWDSLRRITTAELSCLTQKQLEYVGPSVIFPR